MGLSCSGFGCLILLAAVYFPYIIVFGTVIIFAVVFAKRGTKGTFWGRFFKILFWVFLIAAALPVLHFIQFTILNLAFGDMRLDELLENLRRMFSGSQYN